MRNPSPILIALVAFALGSIATYAVVRRTAPNLGPTPSSPTPGGNALYWYDPMAPQQHFDKPGKSPFMDMQLVPKYADAGRAGSVSIDPRLAQSLGVRTARAELGSLERNLRVTGTVAFDEGAITTVPSRVAGIVESLQVRTPMSPVKRGQALLTLIAPEWTAAQEDYLALRRTKSPGLDGLRVAARQRLALLGLEESQIRTLERSGHASVHFTLTAPRDGVARELSVRDGASVAMGTPLFTLNGLDTVWINVAVPETDSGAIVAGAAITATLPAFPGEHFSGTIQTLLPELDLTTRTQRARIVLANPQHRLAPGMFANVEIAAPLAASQSVLAPSEAIIETGTRKVVIVDEGGGHYRAQEVRIGAEGNGKSAVLDGLSEGDNVVLSGQFLIDSEASLTGTLTRLEDASSDSASVPKSMPKHISAEVAEQPELHLAKGTVKKVEGHRWTIATEAIPSLGMGAMVMTFVSSQSVSVAGIHPGQRVSFGFVRNASGEFEIAKIVGIDTSAKGDQP